MRLKQTAFIFGVCGLLLTFAVVATGQSGFVQIDVPGSSSTTATGINDLNQIVGWYTTNNSSGTGFEYNNASFINLNISVPGSLATQPLAINDTGSIVGVFTGSLGSTGFLLNGAGYSAITGPAGSVESSATGIDNSGDIAGWYINSSSVTQGFILNGSTGVYTTLAVPGATSTQITGINPAGGIVAGITDVITPQTGPLPVEVGFLYDYGSSTPAFTSFFLPGAMAINSMSINDSGEIACTFTDTSSSIHGCLSNGVTFSTVDDPNGIGTTNLTGINNSGQIVGWFTGTQDSTVHGFTSVPEPSAAVLWMTGLVMLGLACGYGAKRQRRFATH